MSNNNENFELCEVHDEENSSILSRIKGFSDVYPLDVVQYYNYSTGEKIYKIYDARCNNFEGDSKPICIIDEFGILYYLKSDSERMPLEIIKGTIGIFSDMFEDLVCNKASNENSDPYYDSVDDLEPKKRTRLY